MVGNTKTWVSIGETMQEIATKEELSTMGGAKLVGTSSISYLDGAVCKVTEATGSDSFRYNDYIVVHTADSWSSDFGANWTLVKGSTKTITLLPIEFDYIILRPDPLDATFDCHYYYGSGTNDFKYQVINRTIGSLPGSHDIVIYNNNSIIKRILLRSDGYHDPEKAIETVNQFTLSVKSSTHQLVITADTTDNYSYNYGRGPKYGVWIPDVIKKGRSALIGPCLGLYNILYYKY